MTTGGNDEMVSLWNGEAAGAWVSHADRYASMLAPFGQLVLDAARLAPGERVLDVGCGAGDLAVAAAALVGAGGSVVAVDVSAPLLALARGRDPGEAAPIAFVEADAQVHAFDGPFDAVLSRFGVMFFADPVAAFANLLGATAPGGRLSFVCWQPAPTNEWVLTPLMAITPHVGPPKVPDPGAPGPFAFGDEAHTRDVLARAGWDEVAVDGRTMPIRVGGATTVDEAVDYYADDTLGRMLLAGATAEQREAALSSLRDALAPHLTDGGVDLGAAVWVVTARRPG